MPFYARIANEKFHKKIQKKSLNSKYQNLIAILKIKYFKL
jgi:hypothetical protein